MGDTVPLLEFPFTDVTGTTVPNHGSLGATGDASLGGTTAVTGATPIIRAGYENSALSVDSVSDKMATVDFPSLDALDSFTLSFFVKPLSTGGWLEMMGDTTSTSPPSIYRGWYLQARYINASTGPRNEALFLVGAGSGANAQFYTPDDYILPGTWQHLALAVTGLQTSGSHSITVQFYRNGDPFGLPLSVPTAWTMGPSVGAGFTIGNTHWDGTLTAQYAGVAMFGTALTANEVRDYYGFLTSTPEPGTLVSLVAGMGCLSVWWLVRRRRSRG
jgi:hypothetical protein